MPETLELVRSRWRFTQKQKAAPTFLRSLGIEFRTSEGKDFWEANRYVLTELYHEMLDEARGRIRELHPDTGGNGAEFDNFIQHFRQAKQAFARHLNIRAGDRIPETSAVTVIAKRGSGHGMYRPEKVVLAIAMIRDGYADREVMRELHMHSITVAKIKRIVVGVMKGCRCGKPRGHKGWCSHMMKRSPSRRALVARWHQQQKKAA